MFEVGSSIAVRLIQGTDSHVLPKAHLISFPALSFLDGFA